MEENKTPTLEEVLNQEVSHYDGAPEYGIIPLDVKGRLPVSLVQLEEGKVYNANAFTSNIPIAMRNDYNSVMEPSYTGIGFLVSYNGASLFTNDENAEIIYPLMSSRLHFKLAMVKILKEGSALNWYRQIGNPHTIEVVKIYDPLDAKVSLIDYLDNRERNTGFWKGISAIPIWSSSIHVNNFFMEPAFFDRYKKKLTKNQIDIVKIKHALYIAQPNTPDYKEAEYWNDVLVKRCRYSLPPEISNQRATFAVLSNYTKMLSTLDVKELIKYSTMSISLALRINQYSKEEIGFLEANLISTAIGNGEKCIGQNGLFIDIYKNQKAISAKGAAYIIKALTADFKDELDVNVAAGLYDGILENPYWGKNAKFLNTLLDYTGVIFGKLLARAHTIYYSANGYRLIRAFRAMIPLVSDEVILKVLRSVKKEGKEQLKRVLEKLEDTVLLRTPIVDAYPDYLSMDKMSGNPSQLQLQFFLDETDSMSLFINTQSDQMFERAKAELFETKEDRDAIIKALRKSMEDTMEIPPCFYNKSLPVEIIDLAKEANILDDGMLCRLPKATVAKYIRNNIPYKMFEKHQLPISVLLESMMKYQAPTKAGKSQALKTLNWLYNNMGRTRGMWMSNYNTFLNSDTIRLLIEDDKFALNNDLIKMRLDRIDEITKDGHCLTSEEGDAIEEVYQMIIDNVSEIPYLDPEVWYRLPKHVQNVTKHIVVGWR